MILELKEVLVDDFQSLPSFQIQEIYGFQAGKEMERRKKEAER